jgi:ankyrin repeat protein
MNAPEIRHHFLIRLAAAPGCLNIVWHPLANRIEREPRTSTMAIDPVPFRSTLDSYKQQAEKLLHAFRSNDAEAWRCIRQCHPRLRGRAGTNDRNAVTDSEIRRAKVSVADARSVVAGWDGFDSWPKLAEYVAAVARDDSLVGPFEAAVEAIITGDVATLKRLLRDLPDLIRARSTRAHQATLLHYVAANGVEGHRQKTPKNAAQVAAILLKAGADVDADLDYGAWRRRYPERIGSTTLGLAATSVHPALAGVQIPLLRILLRYGASVDGLPGGWNPLVAALHNGRGDAALFLSKRGARMDLEGAAGVGRLDLVKGFFKTDGSLKTSATKAQMESGFMWACEYGRARVVAFLLEKGMRIDARPHGETGLHQAAYGGHAAVVRLLLKRQAPLHIKDERFDGTPLSWALHGWCYPPPEAKRARHHEVVALLVAAGARVDRADLGRAQRAKLRADQRMRAALGDMVLR